MANYVNEVMFRRAMSTAEKYLPFTIVMEDFAAADSVTYTVTRRPYEGGAQTDISSVSSLTSSGSYRAVAMNGIWLPGETPAEGNYAIVVVMTMTTPYNKTGEGTVVVPVIASGT